MVGLGFTLPSKIADVVRIVRKNEAKPEVENEASIVESCVEALVFGLNRTQIAAALQFGA